MYQFSVLMSLYVKENPSFFYKSLQSVFSQTYKPTEVVLVEDGSITKELSSIVDDFVKLHPEIKVIKLNQNMGLGLALKEGLKHTSYNIVARMDTDDICKPDRFEKQFNYLRFHPEIAVVGSWIDEFIDEPSNVVSTRKLPENHDDIYIFGQKRNPINHPTVMFRKDAVLSVGGYKPFNLFEDYFLWSRMLVSGLKFYNIPESLLYFRVSSDMFKRRGGFKYACTEASFQMTLYKIGYISYPTALKNICVRFMVRIIPNRLRGFIYQKLIRN